MNVLRRCLQQLKAHPFQVSAVDQHRAEQEPWRMQLQQIERHHEEGIETKKLAVRKYSDSAGNEIPERMQRLFNDLEDLGYNVTLTPLAKRDTIGRTFRIYWRGLHRSVGIPDVAEA